jgi:16S rRNA (uracil1498-N3)-methyltransferase
MAEKSIYLPDPFQGRTVRIIGDEHQHLRVSRAQPGEMVDVFDGRGSHWRGEVLRVDKKGADVRVNGRIEVPPPTKETWLAQALIKADAFEWILEKAVEIGVTRIVPFRASRSNVRERDRTTRWSRILVEAAKQSKRYHLPRLDVAASFEDVLAMDAGSRIFFAEGTPSGLASHLPLSSPALVVIGPEGGWTDDERTRAERAGFMMVGLGTHILRSETAAIVAAGLIAHHLGVL